MAGPSVRSRSADTKIVCKSFESRLDLSVRDNKLEKGRTQVNSNMKRFTGPPRESVLLGDFVRRKKAGTTVSTMTELGKRKGQSKTPLKVRKRKEP